MAYFLNHLKRIPTPPHAASYHYRKRTPGREGPIARQYPRVKGKIMYPKALLRRLQLDGRYIDDQNEPGIVLGGIIGTIHVPMWYWMLLSSSRVYFKEAVCKEVSAS